ncbi:AAA family ATPase [Blautia sp. MSJ-19]|uniref:AAA family ATPase n=1 Tax=Blautia sp. MSJ-19 TaxID=2841517 RepID=UPI001C0ED94A|nr:AAA family ATPase [Blautia sp. MSJ-19]MBU5482118.1 ATP-binding protein [Blautia sp. MSJ-19]
MTYGKKLPIGVDDFEKLIREDFYYVDKTGMIADLLRNWGEVNFFTRPRRFGKSLNMNMLKSFFEIGCDKNLFQGLSISKEKELCENYMGQFPVIFISLKGVEGLSFDAACKGLANIIGMEALRFSFLKDSQKLTEDEKALYSGYTNVKEGNFVTAFNIDSLVTSLKRLSALLEKHYEKKVILLIDEYDVPLDKAFQYGYYEEMVSLMRNLLGNVLKTNSSLYFAVLTGCLRISKESIFTGLNNLKVLSITNAQFDEYFGFTDSEVKEMLEYYGLSEHYDSVKSWYDGYRFGNEDIYCPWDVISHCDNLRADPNARPEDYWSNTSSNSIVRRFIDKANGKTKDEIERLIAGETIVKEIRQELTYSELDSSIDNLWSVLFTTGYLTQRGTVGDDKYYLAIPNYEIRKLFIRQIKEWFSKKTRNDGKTLEQFCNAFSDGNSAIIEEMFNDYLWNTISIRDTATPEERKESFYHGLLLGLLGYKDDWIVKSNAESGIGYSDILIEIRENRIGIVVEMKYAANGKLEAACQEALSQIENRKYEARLKEDGMKNIIKYGIACYKKECKVEKGDA